MTSAALSWGCGLLAFGPSASLLFLLAYQKAQLIIVVTTSAFAFLISALFAAMVWWLFDLVGLDLGFVVLMPGVIFQFLLRCMFVSLYHKVEKVIETSIDQHAAQQQQQGEQTDGDTTNDDQAWTDSARLRLELNDWSCGLAAGTGFGGMHALLLYGTLLASEAGNLGTLYQDSCPGVPSLLFSAMNTFLFSILDVLWMLLTFFGMRRRLQDDEVEISHGYGAMLGNNRGAGTNVLIICFMSHLAATLATTLSQSPLGCRVSLPLLACVVLGTISIFAVGVSRVYLPLNQRRRLTGDNHAE